MDNISHSLAGLLLSQAGLNRLTPRAHLILLLAANAPDIDILALTQGQFNYFVMHRGPTHALLAVPVLALACVVLSAALSRRRLPWFSSTFVACIGVLSHLALDCTNNYGVRLLLPFSADWFHLDLNSLTDFPLLTMIAFGLTWPLLSRLVSGEIGDKKHQAGRGVAIAALVLCLLFEGGRYLLHQRAVAQLDSRLFHGQTPLSVAALPESVNPFSWRGIVTTEDAYLVTKVNTLGELSTDGMRTFFRTPPSDITANARKTDEFGFFLYFSRFPVWSIQPLREGSGRRVELTDLRFGEPGSGSFHCVGIEDLDAHMLRAWFTYSNSAELGWTRGSADR